MLTLYHTTNRTATNNGPISLAYAAGLGKYGYGNGIAVTERISGTVLISNSHEPSFVSQLILYYSSKKPLGVCKFTLTI